MVNIKPALLFTRLSIFIVMAVWTADKLLNPQHTQKVFEKFYYISEIPFTLIYLLGALQVLLVLAFLAGVKKRITYGAMGLMHAASTLSSFKQYFSPFEGAHLLFFAAWPMLAACILLYMLRDQDTLLAFKRRE